MKKTNLIISIFFLALLTACLSAGPASAQLYELALNPLQVELAARPLGMGGAFAGLADDLNAALYNPGGLAWAKGISLSLKDSENIVALQAYPTGYGSSFGLAVITSRIENIPISTGVASSNSNIIFLSYGTKLSIIPRFKDHPTFQKIGVGINIKGLVGQNLRRTSQLDRSGTGWDIDLGVLYKATDWWSAGLSLQNILPMGALGGGKIVWNLGGEEGFPAVIRLAGSARVMGDIGSPIFVEGRRVVLSGELNLSQQRPALLKVGGEYVINDRIYLRTGFMQQYKPDGVAGNVDLGVGYRTDVWGTDLAIYRQPQNDQQSICLSFLYFPKDWIVINELEIERPRVMLDTPIESISLQDNIVTYDPTIEVTGRVKPGVEVYINGLRASLDADNSFSAVVPLRLGKNLILVEARYQGEKRVWKYKVLRKASVDIANAERISDLATKKEGVEDLVTMGVIEIKPDEEFVMDTGITRGELSSWLVKAAEMKLPEVKQDLFSDVPKNHPLAPYIKVVVDLKLLQPFPDGTFRPGAIVSKQEGDAIFAKFGM